MDEFGQRRSEQLEDQLDEPGSPSEESPRDSPPKTFRSRRETMPPFSHYAHPPDDHITVPDSDRIGRVRRKERQDVPQILVSPPSVDAANGDKMYVGEGPSAGGCKCGIR